MRLGQTTNTKPNGGAQAYEQLTGEVYTYDRLNRIIASTFNVYTGTVPTGTVPTGTWSTPGQFDTWYDYDANGNILKLNRHDSATAGSLMDSLAYSYSAGTNRLTYIDDATPRAANAAPSTDLEDQAPGNYSYDASGRLIGDVKEGIAAIDWTHYTKVRDVRKTAGVRLHFVYDAQGNRAKKAVAAGGSGETTYYVREAGGKVIAIYTKACLDREDFTGGGASGCIDPAFDDADHDGIADSVDNAPGVFNPTQNDADGDDTADVLDADPDGDGLLGVGDPCPYDPLNSCTGDTDSDGIPDASDPCPTWPGDCWTNPDADNDGDGVPNKEDNCPWTPNTDQADTNANGVGDVCECDDEETGGCPPELAEQYVYGSELDGRVVTVRPARARDMQDHRGDTVFTRVLDKKEYELNDHLGNVRVRFGDVKKSTGTAGTSPFSIDMKGYVNYYPFGMAQPGREVSMSGGRYGYNGKEMDNEWNNAQGVAGNEGTGNSYDYGARIYDPRVGRWLSGDPMESKLPGISTYASCLNTPVRAIDPDGRLVIFVNGFRINHLWDIETLNWPSTNQYEDGYQEVYKGDPYGYWGATDDRFIQRIGDLNVVYFDASNAVFSSAQFRYEVGVVAGKSLLKQIESGEVVLRSGETIKIIAHSQGAAYSAGLASVFDSKKTLTINGVETPMPQVEVVYALAAKQPEDFVWPNVQRSVQYSSAADFIAGDGLVSNTDEYTPLPAKAPEGCYPLGSPSPIQKAMWLERMWKHITSGGQHKVVDYEEFIFSLKPGDQGYVAPRKDAGLFGPLLAPQFAPRSLDAEEQKEEEE